MLNLMLSLAVHNNFVQIVVALAIYSIVCSKSTCSGQLQTLLVVLVTFPTIILVEAISYPCWQFSIIMLQWYSPNNLIPSLTSSFALVILTWAISCYHWQYWTVLPNGTHPGKLLPALALLASFALIVFVQTISYRRQQCSVVSPQQYSPKQSHILADNTKQFCLNNIPLSKLMPLLVEMTSFARIILAQAISYPHQ